MLSSLIKRQSDDIYCGFTTSGIHRDDLTVQINGRDAIEIPDKARLDGEYVEKKGLAFDIKCFFGTFMSVLKSDGVVEGGTGEIKKMNATDTKEESVAYDNWVEEHKEQFGHEPNLFDGV